MADEQRSTTASPVDSATSEAEGQAALLLVESLIHGLIARSIITLEDALDIVDSARTVQVDVVDEVAGTDASAPMLRAHALLSDIERSLRMDSTSNPAASLSSS
jgi:hypothetical protein